MNDLEDVRDHCIRKPGCTEDFPFGEDTLVFRVMGKIFLLTNVNEQTPSKLNLKCDPARALELRAAYRAIQPGYHMNKKHWNTVTLDGSLSDALVADLIDHSYDQVVKGLKRAERDALAAMPAGAFDDDDDSDSDED